MNKVSRRALARVVAQRLIGGNDQKKVMQEAAAYLLEHNMAAQTDMFLNDLAADLERRTGHATATAYVAHAPTPETRRQLERYVTDKTGAQSVELTIEEDPSLIGGVVIRTPEYEYDASVRHKLNQLARGEA